MFECAANGSESLMINWTKNHVHISNQLPYTIANYGKRSILIIERVTIDNGGIYYCITNEMLSSKPAELLSKET